MEKVNLTNAFLLLITISKQNMNFLKCTNGGHCAMVIIMNMKKTTKGD
jgi:hypothetical protein